MNLFFKKIPKNLKEADETGLSIMKCPLFYIHPAFTLESRKMLLSTYNSKKCYIWMNGCENISIRKQSEGNRTKLKHFSLQVDKIIKINEKEHKIQIIASEYKETI